MKLLLLLLPVSVATFLAADDIDLNTNQVKMPKESDAADMPNMPKGVSDYLFQGDMRLTEARRQQIEAEQSTNTDSQNRKKRQAIPSAKWPANTVYYYFDPSINARKKASVYAAVNNFHARTCLNFVYSAMATNRIRIYNGTGCWSWYGMVGGVQDLSLGDDSCNTIGLVGHEFMHALGFDHMQTRSDRDNYVTIDLDNVPSSARSNYNKRTPDKNFLYTPYDYGSVVHYRANSYFVTAGKPSMFARDSRYTYTMGGDFLTFYDYQMINDYYNCTANCPAATSAKCQNGGVPNPRNCATCNCPLGYAGQLCNQKPIDAGCGGTVSATANWQTLQFEFGNKTDFTTKDGFTFCNYWITAPVGKKVQTKITYMYYPQCTYGCLFNGIEIKIDANPRITNPRYCCTEFINQTLTSNLNPTPIIAYNKYYYTTYRIDYRYVDGPTVAPTTKTTPWTTTQTTTRTTPTTKTTSRTTTETTPRTTARTTTTQKTTTTIKATTTFRPPVPVCTDTNSTMCANLAARNACFTTFATVAATKYICGKSCGLCGRAPSPCLDSVPLQCAEIRRIGACHSIPKESEYVCAKTCGFCK